MHCFEDCCERAARINSSPGRGNAATAASIIDVTICAQLNGLSAESVKGEVTRCRSQVHGEWLGPAYALTHTVRGRLTWSVIYIMARDIRAAVVGRHKLITPKMCSLG